MRAGTELSAANKRYRWHHAVKQMPESVKGIWTKLCDLPGRGCNKTVLKQTIVEDYFENAEMWNQTATLRISSKAKVFTKYSHVALLLAVQSLQIC